MITPINSIHSFWFIIHLVYKFEIFGVFSEKHGIENCFFRWLSGFWHRRIYVQWDTAKIRESPLRMIRRFTITILILEGWSGFLAFAAQQSVLEIEHLTTVQITEDCMKSHLCPFADLSWGIPCQVLIVVSDVWLSLMNN